MALPKIDVPIYTVNLPSNKESVKVRPFSVREEKLLLMALESKNADEIIDTVTQVINNCLLEGSVDCTKLPFFDIDYLFLFLRAKSIGETVEVNLTCNNLVGEDEHKCGNVFPTDMDIANCEVIKSDVSDTIQLDPTKGMKMKYPSYAQMKRIEFGNDVDQKTNTIINSIDHIFDKDGIYPARDYSKDELKEYVENLTEENYKKLEKFVDNFPTIMIRIQAECTRCGFNHDVRYSDFLDFFT